MGLGGRIPAWAIAMEAGVMGAGEGVMGAGEGGWAEVKGTRRSSGSESRWWLWRRWQQRWCCGNKESSEYGSGIGSGEVGAEVVVGRESRRRGVKGFFGATGAEA